MGYKIITANQYETEGMKVIGTDEDGNKISKSKWQISNPNARKSPDGKEYVLSNAGTMSKAQVKAYIAKNWPEEYT